MGTSAGAAKRERCPKCGMFKHKSKVCPPLTRKKEPLMDRVNRHTIKHGPDDCWEWDAHKSHNGYAKLGHHYVTRILLGLQKDDGIVARHTCDNPSCVNPAHVVVGSQKDNLTDMVVRGRSNRDDKHWNWKGGKSKNYLKGANRSKVR